MDEIQGWYRTHTNLMLETSLLTCAKYNPVNGWGQSITGSSLSPKGSMINLRSFCFLRFYLCWVKSYHFLHEIIVLSFLDLSLNQHSFWFNGSTSQNWFSKESRRSIFFLMTLWFNKVSHLFVNLIPTHLLLRPRVFK